MSTVSSERVLFGPLVLVTSGAGSNVAPIGRICLRSSIIRMRTSDIHSQGTLVSTMAALPSSFTIRGFGGEALKVTVSSKKPEAPQIAEEATTTSFMSGRADQKYR